MSDKIFAAGPVIVENGEVLLVKAGQDNYWKFCGGKAKDLDCGDLQRTAVREAAEEIGIEFEIIDIVPYIFEKGNYLLYHFLSKRLSKITSGDAREWKWISLRELCKEELAENIIPTLKHFGFLPQ